MSLSDVEATALTREEPQVWLVHPQCDEVRIVVSLQVTVEADGRPLSAAASPRLRSP